MISIFWIAHPIRRDKNLHKCLQKAHAQRHEQNSSKMFSEGPYDGPYHGPYDTKNVFKFRPTRKNFKYVCVHFQDPSNCYPSLSGFL